MTEYRYVYYLSDRCLHNILEICFKNYKFDILDQYEKDELYFILMKNCANRYYNENRIRYFVKKSMKLIESKYVIEELVDIIVKEMINAKLAIEYMSKENYLILLSYEHEQNNINAPNVESKCEYCTLCN